MQTFPPFLRFDATVVLDYIWNIVLNMDAAHRHLLSMHFLWMKTRHSKPANKSNTNKSSSAKSWSFFFFLWFFWPTTKRLTVFWPLAQALPLFVILASSITSSLVSSPLSWCLWRKLNLTLGHGASFPAPGQKNLVLLAFKALKQVI